MSNLLNLLKQYSKENKIAMHMPGHKRDITQQYLKDLNAGYDITEIDGFDNLHQPKGILLESMKKASHLWGAKHSFYLINGTTCGILSAIYATTNPGDKILLMRNSHKSVYNTIEIRALNPIFIQPPFDNETGIYCSVDVESIKNAIKLNPDIKLIVITSPSYEGIISDIKSICQIAHQNNIAVLVDEAHGAHLDFTDYFSGGAIKAGADIVVQSLHKTLPSLTQTAILHINSNLIDKNAVSNALAIFQTSSPSYLLLSSIDSCVDFIKAQGKDYFKKWESNLKCFFEKIKNLKVLSILTPSSLNNIYKFDFSKIVILTAKSNISGADLMKILRENYKIELEMASSYYAIAMTAMLDTKENLLKLANALIEIDNSLKGVNNNWQLPTPTLPTRICSINEALKLQKTQNLLKSSAGKVCAEYVWCYPPGIPLIIPGEIVNKQFVDLIENYKSKGLNIQNSSKTPPDTIKVIK